MKPVVLITGASSGIGLETALNLINKGCIVYGVARRTQLLEPIINAGGSALFLDITDSKSIKTCVQQILKTEGRIDILVNNAGYGLGGTIEDVPTEDARNQFEVNVFGLTQMIQEVLPSMRKNKSGRIINISSMAGKFSSPFMGWYHASKYSVEALSDALRVEVKPFGIKVCVIEPGLIRTDWGIIAAKNIRKYSDKSAYKLNAESAANYYEKYYCASNSRISKPSLISDAITNAALSKHPKSRYLKGSFSHLFANARKFLSDRMIDALIMRFMKLKKKI